VDGFINVTILSLAFLHFFHYLPDVLSAIEHEVSFCFYGAILFPPLFF